MLASGASQGDSAVDSSSGQRFAKNGGFFDSMPSIGSMANSVMGSMSDAPKFGEPCKRDMSKGEDGRKGDCYQDASAVKVEGKDGKVVEKDVKFMFCDIHSGIDMENTGRGDVDKRETEKEAGSMSKNKGKSCTAKADCRAKIRKVMTELESLGKDYKSGFCQPPRQNGECYDDDECAAMPIIKEDGKPEYGRSHPASCDTVKNTCTINPGAFRTINGTSKFEDNMAKENGDCWNDAWCGINEGAKQYMPQEPMPNVVNLKCHKTDKKEAGKCVECVEDKDCAYTSTSLEEDPYRWAGKFIFKARSYKKYIRRCDTCEPDKDSLVILGGAMKFEWLKCDEPYGTSASGLDESKCADVPQWKGTCEGKPEETAIRARLGLVECRSKVFTHYSNYAVPMIHRGDFPPAEINKASICEENKCVPVEVVDPPKETEGTTTTTVQPVPKVY